VVLAGVRENERDTEHDPLTDEHEVPVDGTDRVEEAEVCEVRRCAGEDADLTAVDEVVTGIDELQRALVGE
jgi:hypothetical protein